MDALLEASVRLAAPLLIAAVGELLVERSGVVNIGIEGTMLLGAFAGYAVAVSTGSAALGAGGGVLAGIGAGALFAGFAVLRKADQIVVGMAINLLALGATGLAFRALYPGASPPAPILAPLGSDALAGIPLLGALVFRQTPFALGSFALAAGAAAYLARTRSGLRLRAVGESARAADSEGVDVERVRVGAVLVGSALAGLAGAALPLAQSGAFTEGMTAGRGFIALAVVIFGRWSAWGAAGAALLFGAATAVQFRLQARGAAVPYPLFLMLPYLVTLAALALAAAAGRAPGDLGRSYRRESA